MHHELHTVLATISLLVLFVVPAPAFELSGKAIIVDGDTLIISDRTIRLHGIDAPEFGQKCKTEIGTSWHCGRRAMARLAELAERKHVTCVGDAIDVFDRLIAVCRANKTEINSELVQEGLAWAFVKYSADYVEQEDTARSKRVGIWQGQATPAWNYRAEKWAVAKQKSPEGCPIKGNISSSGRIYHPPWSPWYARTRVSIENGERWFCSEREALDAGWRAPRWR